MRLIVISQRHRALALLSMSWQVSSHPEGGTPVANLRLFVDVLVDMMKDGRCTSHDVG